MVATMSAFRSYWNLNRSCFINKVASYENRQYCDWGRAFTRPQSILMPKANDSQRYPLSMRLYVMLPQSAFGESDEIFWMLGCNLPQQQHYRFCRRRVAYSIYGSVWRITTPFTGRILDVWALRTYQPCGVCVCVCTYRIIWLNLSTVWEWMMTTPNARLRTISMTNYRSNHPLFTQLITRDVPIELSFSHYKYDWQCVLARRWAIAGRSTFWKATTPKGSYAVK